MVKVFVGHDWAEAHHDLHIEDEHGTRLAKGRVTEGMDGVRHCCIGAQARSAVRVA